MKKILVFFIAFGLLMQPFSVFGNIDIKTKDENDLFIDIDGHWAEETIIRHYEMGMIEGYPNGTFKPDQDMKRSELITVLNRNFGLKENENDNFQDISNEDWYAKETAKAKYYGYIEELSVRAEEPARRQDVVKMISILLDIEEQELIKGSIDFTDLENIDEDMKVIIEKFTEMGWINGYGDKTFRPEKIIKRAEIMTISENVLGYVVSSQEDLENIPEDVKKVTIISPGIVVENKIIEGDLYISPGVNGQIIIKDTQVKGQIQVSGGLIQIENVEALKVVITKAKKTPKVEIKGESEIGEVKTKTESEIEVAGKTIIEVVNTESKTVMKMQEGTQIKKLVINEETKLDTDKGSTISELVSSGKTEITGEGEIEKAIIKNDEVTIEKEPDYVKVDNNVDGVNIAGKEVDSKNDDHRKSSNKGDRTAPIGYSVNIDQSSINNSNKTALSFTFASAEVGATYNYSIDDITDSTNAITGNGTISSATQQISNIDVSSLTDGTLTLTVYLTDVATNQGGNVTDTVTKDTTVPKPPTATTADASSISSTGATLNGTVDDNGSDTTVTFEYGTTTSYGTTVTADQSPVTGNTNTAVSKAITGLTPNTTYHYRVMSQNARGITYGADRTFTTVAAATPPTATTADASSISSTGATLNGTVDDNGSDTTVTFEYGTTTSYGTTVTADQSPVTGNTNTAVSKAITGLTPNTTYHYRVVSQNALGTTIGADRTFTTVAATTDETAPTAGNSGSLSTSGISTSSVTVNWTKATDNFSAQATLEYLVYYSTLDNIATVSDMEANGTSFGSYTADISTKAITGLSDSTTYYFNVIVRDEAGNQTAYTATNAATTDGTAPTAGNSGSLSTSGISTSSVTVNWTKATDNFSAQATLEYLVYYSTLDNIATVSDMEANGTSFGSYTADISTKVITGLSDSTTYYFNVIVRDEAGNQTAYTATSAATTGGAPSDYALYVNFDSGSTTDQAGNYTLLTNGSPIQINDRHGNANNAYQFNSSSYFSISNFANTADSSTWMCWMKIPSSTSVTELYAFGYATSGSNNYPGVYYYRPGPNIGYEVGGSYTDFTSAVSTDTWIHVTVTKSGSTVKLYINGTATTETKTQSGNEASGNNTLLIGQRHSVAYFDGGIDEFMFFDRVLSDAEVNLIYNNQKP